MICSDFRVAYDYLTQIFRDNAYVHIAMKENGNRRVKKIVFGVLEKYYELDYIVETLSDKGVKNNLKPMLYIAVYAVKYLKTPVPVVQNEVSRALKEIGKSATEKFAHAIVLKADNQEYELPKKSDKRYVEVKYNMPAWVVGLYKKNYPDKYEELLCEKEFSLTHIWLNDGTTEADILKADKDAKKTLTGYFVKKNKEIDLMCFLGQITIMSLGSTLIAESTDVCEGKKVLDVCSAPGGKAVYMAQKGGDVTACDIHEHRLELIDSYSKRMNKNISIHKQDATKRVKEWEEKFDIVLADVPCSGFGVVGKKRDLVFNRTYEDILSLSALQKLILENVAAYVKRGGTLVYSTCTLFSIENENIVNDFLKTHADFHKEKINLQYENKGEIQFLPDGKGMEGFFVCKMKRD